MNNRVEEKKNFPHRNFQVIKIQITYAYIIYTYITVHTVYSLLKFQDD